MKGIQLADIRRAIKGNILFLGLVSFFTDLSSEMIYPLLPVFFTGLVPPAWAAIYIGLMDGIAESTSSLLKIYAGNLSDKFGSRKPLALGGYAISSLARPLMAIAMVGWHVVALRFFDRIGKGIRTSPRDALLSDSVDCDVRGLAFSFHRMMDHAGAVGGPLLATLFLYLTLGSNILWQKGGGAATADEMHALRIVFAIALIPGLAATITIWRWVKDTPLKARPVD
jgi:MFS family permease